VRDTYPWMGTRRLIELGRSRGLSPLSEKEGLRHAGRLVLNARPPWEATMTATAQCRPALPRLFLCMDHVPWRVRCRLGRAYIGKQKGCVVADSCRLQQEHHRCTLSLYKSTFPRTALPHGARVLKCPVRRCILNGVECPPPQAIRIKRQRQSNISVPPLYTRPACLTTSRSTLSVCSSTDPRALDLVEHSTPSTSSPLLLQFLLHAGSRADCSLLPPYDDTATLSRHTPKYTIQCPTEPSAAKHNPTSPSRRFHCFEQYIRRVLASDIHWHPVSRKP
jgi:hypothetical protein